MSWITNIFKKQKILTEELPSFKNKGNSAISNKQIINRSGEGVTGFITGYGKESLTSFNNFYGSYINTAHANERDKIRNYRMMAQMPEIASVIEDIIIESTGEDNEGKIITFKILDLEYQNNENIQNNLTDQFTDLFYKKLKINDIIWDFIKTYYIDGKVFIEKIIQKNKPSNGIISLKKLPTETMDFDIDPITSKINVFYQYLKPNAKRPKSIEDAKKDKNIIVFYPEQIIFLDYGLYGSSKEEIFGYLEKVKQPFNQLKLLETSVVIYRLVKSPERLVFKIDTGAMPKDKAMAFVEKVKQKFSQKVSYDQNKGTLVNDPNIISMLDNYFLPQSADGRGSNIESIGGNPSGFAEIDDIWYFNRKLYTALKYPMSRVMNMQEGRQGDTMFMGGQTGEISRDEIRWAKFLERHQNKFEQSFTELFLLHLEFQGLKKEYDIDSSKINIVMTPPNNYKQQMQQMLLESQMNNYQTLANNSEFSKGYLQRKYLKWDDDDIKLNAEYHKEDAKLIPKDEY
jgi:hypothetical protein